MDYGNKIYTLRTARNLSQEELANMLFVSRDLISKWENAKRRPDIKSLEKMSVIFNVDIDYFESPKKQILNELSKCIPKDTEMSVESFTKILNLFLKTVSQRDANVFIRRYYFLETPFEISQKYKIGEAYTRVILARTRNKLKKFLERGENSDR